MLQLSQDTHVFLLFLEDFFFYKRRGPECFKSLLWPNWKKKKQTQKPKTKNHCPWGKSKPVETILRMGQMSMNCKGNYICSCGIGFSCWENKAWGSHLYGKYCCEATISVFISLKQWHCILSHGTSFPGVPVLIGKCSLGYSVSSRHSFLGSFAPCQSPLHPGHLPLLLKINTSFY